MTAKPKKAARQPEVAAHQSAPQQETASSPREPMLVFFAVLFIALAIRMVRFGSFGIWEDEGYTAMLISQPWHDFIYLMRFDSSPPVYYVLLKLWAGLFGMGEVSLKLPSLILSLGALSGVYGAARRHFGGNVAAIAALLFAFSPMQVWYSHNFRYYALIEVIAAVSIGKVLDIGRSVETKSGVKASDLFWWALLMVLGFYTHVLFAMAFVIQGAYILWMALRRRHDVRRVLTTSGAVLVLCLPWIAPFISQQRATLAYQTSLAAPKLGDYGRAVSDFLFLYAPHWASIWYFLPLAAILLIAVLGAWSRPGPRSARWFLFASVLVPPIAAFGLALLFHQPLLFNRRYFIPSSIAMLMLAGVALLDVEALFKRWFNVEWRIGGVKEILVVVLLGLNVLGLGYLYTAPFAMNRDWRSAAAYLHMREEDETAPHLLLLNMESASNLTTYYANCFSYYWLRMPRDKELVRHWPADRYIVSPDGPVGPNDVISTHFAAEGDAGWSYFAYSPPNVPFVSIPKVVRRDMARYGSTEVWFIYPLRFSGATGIPVPIGHQMLKYLPGRYMIRLSYQFDGVGMDCAVPISTVGKRQ